MSESLSLSNCVVGGLVLIIFLAGALLLVTRRLPALITLPLMAAGIAGGTALVTHLPFYEGATISAGDLFNKVLPQGIAYTSNAILIAFLGGMLSFIMQKSGVAHNLVRQAAELIGDNPLAVSCFSLLLVAMLFTTIGGLGAVIMVALVVLPMLATVGVPPAVAGGIMLIGLSMGGIMNPQAWAFYMDSLKLPMETVRGFAMILFLLIGYTGIVFICVELFRAGTLRRLHHAVLMLAVSGALVAIIIAALLLRAAEVTLPVFSPEMRGNWATYDSTGQMVTEFGDGEVQFTLQPPYTGEIPILATASNAGWENLRSESTRIPASVAEFESVSFTVNSTRAAKMIFRVTSGRESYEQTVAIDAKPVDVTLKADEIAPRLGDAPIDGIRVSLADVAGNEAARFVVGNIRYTVRKKTSAAVQWARYAVGGALGFITLIAFVDLLKRVRTWRRQVVIIKWYAYLIPVVPLILIILFDMNIMASFLLGFAYAVLVTARPGGVSLAIQSMIQGASSVMPAVILMLGIGILLVSMLGPAGWSDANGGAEWPVISAVKPLFAAVLPRGPIGYVVIFSLAAPLALYRGPLNVWGLGFGVASIMMAATNPLGAPLLSEGAIMAMLMTVGQIQGICDPTNTANVWLANELRVDVNSLMLKTIPYVWGLVVVGLIIASLRYFA